MPQHEDPLVYNADTGEWQNASNPGPGGIPRGVAIGTPGGSLVRMAPGVGATVQVDGAAVATIGAAYQLDTGAGTQTQPGYVCSLVFNPGAANEQLGQLNISALSMSNTAQATLMTSDSADGTIKGTSKTGTVIPGTGGNTWSFTTAHQVIPSSKSIQVAQGFNLNATDPSNPAIPEDWHQITSMKNGWAGFLNYILVPVGNGGLVVLQWYFTPGAVADGTEICSLPNVYAPNGGTRIPGASDGIKTSGGNLESPHIQVVAVSGNINSFGISSGATFFAGSGAYPVNVSGTG